MRYTAAGESHALFDLSTMTIKLLAVGDLHLGRQPTGLPTPLRERASALGPAAAWHRVVAGAIETGVDAVALAGDVVEQENDFFEAYRELAAGVRKLLDAGIEVLAVAGNHDVMVLPRLADQIEGFRLLGRGGHWQRVTVERGTAAFTLHGWSFPRREVSGSPLAGARFEIGPGVNLGLLHCDRDQTHSRYAPVTSVELRGAGLDGWLLGHIHAPDRLAPDDLCGYLGSVTGLNVGEPGLHGPWLITMAEGRITDIRQWPLAPLQWQALDIDLTGISSAEDGRDRLLTEVRRLDRSLAAARWMPQAVGLRARFTGRTRLWAALQALLQGEDMSVIPGAESGIHFFVERLRFHCLPPRALEELGAQADPPGLLARRLLALDRPADDSERRRLIEGARRQLTERAGQRHWQALNTPAPTDEQVTDWLRESGLALLDGLLGQREADG